MATYGYTGTGTAEDGTDNYIVAYPVLFSGPTGSVLSAAHWYGRRTSGSGTNDVYVGLYTNGASLPVTRLDFITISCALTTTLTDYSASGGSYSLVTGTNYWIASACNLGIGWANRYAAAASPAAYEAGTGLPATMSATSWTNSQFAFYFDYTEPLGRIKRLVKLQAVNRASTY